MKTDDRLVSVELECKELERKLLSADWDDVVVYQDKIEEYRKMSEKGELYAPRF